MYRCLIAAAFLAVLALPAYAQADIIPRSKWGAEKPKTPLSEKSDHIVKYLKQSRARPSDKVCIETTMDLRREAKYLTVHHTAERSKNGPFLSEMKKHQTNMFAYHQAGPPQKFIFWGDTPYHFRIDNSGLVAEGRELKFSAKSNTIYKTPIEDHITVVLEGNFDVETPDRRQIAALVELLARLAKEHNIPLQRITYHAEVANTPCPGKAVIDEFPAIIQAVRKLGIERSNEQPLQSTGSDAQQVCKRFDEL
jgi:hypothetical protein